MKKILNIMLLAAAAVAATSCGDASIPVFNSDYNAVRFTGIAGDPDYASYNSADRLSYYNFSFVEAPEATEYVYNIPVYISGMVSDKDSVVNFEVDAENTTAPEGSFEVVSAMIPAGERIGAIAVRIFRTEELFEQSYTLALHLLPSDDLQTSDSRYLDTRFTWNSVIPFPPNNNYNRTYNLIIKTPVAETSTSAVYISANALLAIVAATGWDDWDTPENHPDFPSTSATYWAYKYLPHYAVVYTSGAYKAYSLKVSKYLEQYEREHGEPLLHDSGTLAGEPVEARYK